MVAKGFGAVLAVDPASPKYGQYWQSTPCNGCPHSPNCDITGPVAGMADGTIDMRDVRLVAKLFGTMDP
jgi:hypothetical protein